MRKSQPFAKARDMDIVLGLNEWAKNVVQGEPILLHTEQKVFEYPDGHLEIKESKPVHKLVVKQEEMGSFDVLVKDIIKEIATRNGWEIVLMEEALVFVNPSVVKTKMVVEELDKKVKALNQAKKQAVEKAAATSSTKKS